MIDLNALPLAGEQASLLAVLGGLTGPRKKRGVRRQIAATLTMVVAAGLADCGRSFRSAGDFVADLPQEALARLGARYHPVRRCCIAPDEATIRRHVKMTDADEADRLAGGWLLAQVRAGRLAAGQAAGLMVALDGKVLKGAWEELRGAGHDGTSPELPAASGPSTDLAIILASSASTRARACSGRPSHRPAEPSWPANKASCRAGAVLTTRMGSPLPVRLPRSGTR